METHNQYISEESKKAFIRAFAAYGESIDNFESDLELFHLLENVPYFNSSDKDFFVQWTDHRDCSLLTHAARNGYIRVAEYLIHRGADLILFKDTISSFPAQTAESSPLVIAIKYRHIDVAEMFLNLYDQYRKPLSAPLAGVCLITLGLTYNDLSNDAFVSNIFTMIIGLAQNKINEPFRYVGESDSFCPVIVHAASMSSLPHLVCNLLLVNEMESKLHDEAICMAASRGHLHVVDVIISNSICLTPAGISRALILICEHDAQDVIQVASKLIACGASPNQPDESSITAVSVATRKNNLPLLTFLLQEGGDPIDGFEYIEDMEEGKSSKGYRAFCLLLNILETNSVCANCFDRRKNGIPLISLLAMKCPGDFIELAIERGASFSFENDNMDPEFRTPLDWACRMDNISAADSLLCAGADVNAWCGNKGWLCFHTAVEYGSIELIEMLLRQNINLNAQMNTNHHRLCTALHLAIIRGDRYLVELILEQRHVNVNMMNDKHRTPLFDAVVNGCSDLDSRHVQIVKLLLRKGADPNIADDLNDTPLSTAIESGHKEMVKLLVEKNADIEFRNMSGDSPISIAAENLSDQVSIDVMKMVLHSVVDHLDTPASANNLKSKIKTYLVNGNNHIVAALGLVMLESPESRKIITDSPLLWKVPRAPHKRLSYSWIQGFSYDEPSRESTPMSPTQQTLRKRATTLAFFAGSMEDRIRTIHHENMLTWAIAKKNNLAVRLLLESQNKEKQLPRRWRSDLCTNSTQVGTPLRCAIDEENVEAVFSILKVIKSSWNFKFTSKSKQKNGLHPLDNLLYQDLLLVLASYPSVMIDFFKDISLVPAYSWVSGINRAPIADDNSMWISLTKIRSPMNLWKKFAERKGKCKRYIRPGRKVKTDLPTRKKGASQDFSQYETDRMSSVNTGMYYSQTYNTNVFEESENDTPKRKNRVVKKISYLKMLRKRIGRMFGGQIFSVDFDIDQVCEERDMIPFIYDVSSIERDVEAYLVPVKHFSNYEILYACVRACDKVGNPMLFNSDVIATIVQLHWRLYGYRIHNINLRLYIVLLASFATVNYAYLSSYESGGVYFAALICLQVYKSAYSIYYIVHEVLQFRHEGGAWNYFSDPWNILDIPSYALIISGVVLQSLDPYDQVVDAVHGVSSLLLWFRLLYFMRPFSKYGPMVLMIFQVIYDIKMFLVVLFTVMIGFGNAFFLILGGRSSGVECNYAIDIIQEICQDGVGKDGPFNTIFYALRSSFSFMLGSYDFDDLDDGLFPVFLSLLWAIFMIIVTIILLNLLIAIISESYTRVAATKIPSWRMEQARVIVNIYAGIKQEERNNLRQLLSLYPWLQVLVPKKHAYTSHKEEEEINKLVEEYPWLRHFRKKDD